MSAVQYRRRSEIRALLLSSVFCVIPTGRMPSAGWKLQNPEEARFWPSVWTLAGAAKSSRKIYASVCSSRASRLPQGRPHTPLTGLDQLGELPASIMACALWRMPLVLRLVSDVPVPMPMSDFVLDDTNAHPVPEMLKRVLEVIVNSDDLACFGSQLTDSLQPSSPVSGLPGIRRYNRFAKVLPAVIYRRKR